MFLKHLFEGLNTHKKIVITSVIVISIAAIVFIAPFLMAFMPEPVIDYVYREMTYKYVASNVTNGLEDDEDKLRALFNYVKLNENTESSYMAVDEPSLDSMVIGVAWCDQEAQLLGTLLNECNIKSRLRDVQNHTALEVYLDGKWRLIDPFFGELFYTKDDKIATLQDVLEGYGKTVFNKRFEEMLVANNFNILPEKLYEPNEVRWKDGIGPEYGKSKTIFKKVTDKIINIWCFIYGKSYEYWFQDNYLNRYNTEDQGDNYIYNYESLYKKNDIAFETYFKARNYHLYGRYGKALELYNIVAEKSKDSFWAKESNYYTGVLYYDKKNYIKAEEIFANIPELNKGKYNRALLVSKLVSARDDYNLNRLKIISTNEETGVVNVFSQGLSRVLSGGKWGYLDTSGKMAISPQFDYAYNFSEGLARVLVGDKWGFIDSSGKFVINPVFSVVNDFSEGVSLVSYSDGKTGFIDKTGNVVKQNDFVKCMEYKNGFAGISDGKKWGFINKSGNVVIDLKYDSVENFSEGLAAVCVNKKWGYIDSSGNLIIKPEFDMANGFSGGMASISIDGKWGFIDENGDMTVKPQYDAVKDFNEGKAGVCINKKWGFIDKHGNQIIQPEFIDIRSFSGNRAAVNINGKWGFIDETGNNVIEPQYDSASSFSDGLACISKSSYWQCIDPEGRILGEGEL